MRFKEGERVSHEDLGDGEVIEVIMWNRKTDAGYLVQFEETPAVRYNMAQNPCIVLPYTLKKQ